MKQPSTTRRRGFAEVPTARIPRSTFNRSHGYKTTMDAGWLIPFYVDEVLPGDTFNMRANGFVRLATPIKPLMDNLHLETFFFAVPYRLVWENWERFNGAQDNPTDSTDYSIPQTRLDPDAGPNGYITGRLPDYMGLPVGVTSNNWTHSCLPIRAYYLIWNEWFRDQNLQQSVNGVGAPGLTFSRNNGPDGAPGGGHPLMKRGKRHDYFTSCLPWPQKGPDVVIPTSFSQMGAPTFQNSTSGGGIGALETVAAGTNPAVRVQGTNWALNDKLEWANPDLSLELTINDLRNASAIQKLLERDARGGTRYVELILQHFRVQSPDFRLQRPEYLGGGSANIHVSPVAQTSQSPTTPSATETPQANLSGIGTGSFEGHGFVKSFTEHCILIGLIAARADLNYQEGLERQWSRTTRYDHFWPEFVGLGEQEVLNKEIYVSGTPATDNQVFGYQERHAEYRYKPSRVTGLFRSKTKDGSGASPASLDYWHVAQTFASTPALNDTFIQEDPPLDRVVAVPAEPKFLVDMWLNLKCARPMPVYAVPGISRL